MGDDDAMRPSALRLVQQTTRRLQQQQQRWPVLTLFSKAQNCSLCDDAKAAIERVRQRPDAPRFELHVYDISRRAQDDDPDWEARLAWRRLYQYDIPVLHVSASKEHDSVSGRDGRHGGRVMKHRVDEAKLLDILQLWSARLQTTAAAAKTTGL